MIYFVGKETAGADKVPQGAEGFRKDGQVVKPIYHTENRGPQYQMAHLEEV